jgi:menaquinone-specific isochorismate synthase
MRHFQFNDSGEITDNKLNKLTARAKKENFSLPLVIRRPVKPFYIFAWLNKQSGFPKCYWADREGQFEIGGAGYGYHLKSSQPLVDKNKTSSLLTELDEPLPIYIYGRSFEDLEIRNFEDDIWHDFPRKILFVPEISAVRYQDRCYLQYCLTAAPGVEPGKRLSKAKAFLETGAVSSDSLREYKIPRIHSITHNPDYSSWIHNMKMVLRAIAEKNIGKAVLARRSDYYFNEPIDAAGLFQRLKKNNQSTYAIYFQSAPQLTFLSVSPECLYKKEDNLIFIDALSSTVERTGNENEDQRLEKQLLDDAKQRLEHQQVIDGVLEQAGHLLAAPIKIGDTAVKKLDRVQHLWTPISAKLNSNVSDNEILRRLHPTPAVGGRPRENALDLIAELEPFSRGYYASPFGVMAGSDSEIAVAIRSMVVRDKTISVFAGAGIVEGSDFDKEWREVENKDILKPLLSG